MKPLKVVFISYYYWPPSFGGALLRMIQVFKSLGDCGYQIIVLTSREEGYPGFEEDGNIQIQRFRPAPILHELSFFLWLNAKLFLLDFDALYLGGVPGRGSFLKSIVNFLFSMIARLKHASVIASVTLAESEEAPFKISRRKKIQYALVDRIVCISPLLFDAVSKHFPKQAFLLPNGVRDDIFKPLDGNKRKEMREARGISDDDLIFLFIGSLTYRKGFDRLALSFSQLHEKGCFLWVVGPSKREDSQNIVDGESKQVIAPIQTDERVFYWGRINDRKKLAQIIASTDVLVLPSRREGLPNVILEAMSCGIPVIASNLPGCTDYVVKDGVTGFILDSNRVETLLAAMRKLLYNPELRHKFGENGRLRVESEFGWKNYIKRWESLLSQLAIKKKPNKGGRIPLP